MRLLLLLALLLPHCTERGDAQQGAMYLRGATDDTYVGNVGDRLNSLIYGQKPDSSYAVPQLDTNGNIIVSGQTGETTARFNFGDIATSATTDVTVRKTTYNEQSSDAQRSIVSSSANDTSAGTGARTVRLTYFSCSSGVGALTTLDLTMNGTTAVNTGSTDICYIERMEVLTVGSGGSNAGTITLKTTTGGGGSDIGSIAVGDNATFLAHHYVSSTLDAFVTGVALSNDKSSIDSGAVFYLRVKDLSGSNKADRQVTERLRYFAQDSTFVRNYTTPIKVDGPAVVTCRVIPDNGTNMTNRCGFDFYEQ